MVQDRVALRGRGIAELYAPGGRLVAREPFDNLITDIGARMYGENGAGIDGAPDFPTGMKLGLGSTPPATVGSGAELATYLAGSAQTLDDGYPQSQIEAGLRRIRYQATWGPGEGTSGDPLTEIALVNETIADETSDAAATVARALLSSIASKPADHTLVITWDHELPSSTAS